MRYWGFDDAAVTAGPHSGFDVTSARALAHVRLQPAAVDRPTLQEFVGARHDPARRLLFFAGTSYSSQALGYAEEMGIGLFTFDASGGRMCPHTNPARAVVDAARARDLAEDREQPQATSNGYLPPATAPPAPAAPPTYAPAATGPVTTSPLVAGQSRQRLPNSRAAGCLAVLLFVAATCLQIGVLAAAYRPDGITLLTALVALAGAVAYVIGVLTLVIGVVAARREGRRAAPAISVLVASAPGVALWIATGMYIDQDRGTSAGFLQAIIMTIPLVGLLAVALRPLEVRK
jgi:hypothetical protein